MSDLYSIIIAAVMTLVAIIFLRPVAIHLGLVDTPGGRKKHEGAIPLIGGIAMFCGFSFGLLSLNISLITYRGFLASCLFLVFTGVLDDFHELSAKKKLVAQIIVAFMITLWGKVLLHNLGNLLFIRDIHLHLFSPIITIVAIVGIINAVNMIDGIDGLGGGVALIQFLFLYYLAYHSQRFFDEKILLLLIAVLIIFLLFNFPFSRFKQNKIFMGDGGSMFIGLSLVWFAITMTQQDNSAARPVTMLWILAVPLLDTFAAIIRRWRKGRSPFSPDNSHFHHVLVHAGYTKFQTVIFIYVLSLLLGAIGIISDHYKISEGMMFCSFAIVFVVYLYAVKYAWRLAKIIRRNRHVLISIKN